MIPRAMFRCFRARRWSSSAVGADGSASAISGYKSRNGRDSPVAACVAQLFRNAAFSSIATHLVDEVIIDCCHQNNHQELQSELTAIVKPYYQNQQPVVVRGFVKEVPATKLWSSWDYWQKATNPIDSGGDQIVSVEIGGSYGTEGSEKAEIPFSAYLQFLQLFEERHGRKGSLPGDETAATTTTRTSNKIPTEELVYMAQNDLLAQLHKDVVIPDFCQNESDEQSEKVDINPASSSDSTTIGLGRLYSVMMWLGPRGCVSPLHYDPLDNCFLQHMGRKRVLLFEPSKNSTGGGWHYAGQNGQQSNTSPIDPEVLDDNDQDVDNKLKDDYQLRYPLFFEEAPTRLECVLEPGDFLYIPSKWWHHVRSIDTSASVNVWWR